MLELYYFFCNTQMVMLTTGELFGNILASVIIYNLINEQVCNCLPRFINCIELFKRGNYPTAPL